MDGWIFAAFALGTFIGFVSGGLSMLGYVSYKSYIGYMKVQKQALEEIEKMEKRAMYSPPTGGMSA